MLLRNLRKEEDKMSAEEYVKSRMNEWNVNHLVDELDPFYTDTLLHLMEQYVKYRTT